MRGRLTYNQETRVAQVQCGQNGCNAASTGRFTDEHEAAKTFRWQDWRKTNSGMWVCGKHPAAPNPPNASATQQRPLAGQDGGAS
jgi:hypothetical protein